MHPAASVDECLIAVRGERTPDVGALLAEAGKVVVVARAVRVVDEEVDQTGRKKFALVEAVLTSGRQLVMELLVTLDRLRFGEPRLVVRRVFALELKCAEHPGHAVAHMLETWRVS